jgi:hypothetical protein
VIGVEQGFGEQATYVIVRRRVVDEGSLTASLDEPGEAELRQVLADCGRSGVDEFGQASHRGLALQ